MGDKPEDKKGFAGFDSFADEFAVEIPDTPPSSSASVKSPNAAPESPQEPPAQTKTIFEGKPKRITSNGKWWLWVTAGVVGVCWLLSLSDNKGQQTSNPSRNQQTYTTYNSAPAEAETKPPVGQNNVLNESQIRYCLSEKGRMDAMQGAINNYVSSEVDAFNAAVSDYNSRCGAFRYRTSEFNRVNVEVAANHAALYTQGIDRLKSWRGGSQAAQPTAAKSWDAVSTPVQPNQLFWDQPTKLQGIYHKSHFQNCCLQGIAKDTPYSFLELYKPVSVSDTSGGTDWNLRGITVVQLSADQSVLGGIENGDAITVSCKSLSQGFTGHYALLVYCNIVSAEKIKNFTTEKNKYLIAQELLNESIEQDSGLLLSRRNAQGDYLPLTGGYEDNSKFNVTLQGQTILEDTSAAYANFKYFHRVGNEDVVDLETSSGGNACPSEQQLIVIVDGAVTLKKGFGNCSDPEITMPNSQQINFNFYVGYGKRLLAIYKNHDLTEKQIILPPHYDPEGNMDGYEYLEKYVPKNDVENILLDSKLNPQLQNLLGGDFTKLTDRLGVFEPHPVSDGYIVISGAIPHSFTSDEGYLAIAVDGSAIYAGVYETEYNTQTKTSVSFLRAYSSQPAASSNPPASMYQWLARFKNASPNWKYLTQ